MGVTTMKELCEYSKQQQKLRAAEHRRKHAHEGPCSGLTDAEYNRMVIRQKSTFSKARKFTHNRMWREQSKNYSVEQLKIIAKS